MKENDYFVTEAAGLMTSRVENSLAKREQFAMDQRKTKRKDIVQSKRELYSCKTPL